MQRQQTGGRLKATMFLGAALIVAGMVSYLVWKALKNAETQLRAAEKGPEKIEVIVATRDLYMGIPIDAEDLKVIEVLPTSVDPDKVFMGDTLDLVVSKGLTPRERILGGEVLRVERMARREAGIGLNAIVPPGKRAMTIETDAQSSLSGLLQPGNYVDTIVTIRPDDRSIGAKWVTETILQGVKVLAIGDSLSPVNKAAEQAKESKKRSARRRGRPTVTLELTLEESEKLALAASRGDIHLVLRSDIDITQEETSGPLSTNELMGLDVATRAAKSNRGRGRGRGTAPPPPNTMTAEVIEGADTTSVKFDESGAKVDESTNRRRR
jgi:pilus assembly protein CpaB